MSGEDFNRALNCLYDYYLYQSKQEGIPPPHLSIDEEQMHGNYRLPEALVVPSNDGQNLWIRRKELVWKAQGRINRYGYLRLNGETNVKA